MNEEIVDPPHRKRMWPRVLAGLIVLALLCGAVVFIYQMTTRYLRRQERINNMKQVWLGLRNYADAHRRLPKAVRLDVAGDPISNWRLDMIWYMEEIEVNPHLYKRWDDPAKKDFYEAAPTYFCYAARGKRKQVYSRAERHTNLMAITGPGTPFDGQKECRLEDLDPDTILVVEVADSGVHWMAPGDLSIDDLPEKLVNGLEGDGLCVLFADSAAWFLGNDVPLDDLKKFFTIEGAKQYDREKVLGPYVRTK